MRRKNGFTLIELLAVIIILGVIMLIAIPSVTQQITNSRKNSYVDTAQQYINAVVTKVNEGNISMFDTKRLYLVPVGNDDTVSCVSLESGGASPFSRYYKYAYVAVHYTGTGYDYWFLAQDGANQGFKTESSKNLEKSGKSLVLSNMKTPNTNLTNMYGTYETTGTNKNTYSASSITGDSRILKDTALSTFTGSDDTDSQLKTVLEDTKLGTGTDKEPYTSVEFIAVSSCKN